MVMNDRRIRLEMLKAKAVSFDIFDTFILRPFPTPASLFHYLELSQKAKKFYSERVNAEAAARRLTTASEEISLQDIYDHMPPRFQHLRDVEIGLEEGLALANPEILELYRQAKKMGKKVVFTSDMYLPLPVIKKMLVRCGADPEDEVLLSSEQGLTKSRGTLFDKLIEHLGVAPENILHIGDNLNSDVTMARSRGITAIHYLSPYSRYWNSFFLRPYREQYKWISPQFHQFLGLNFLRWYFGDARKNSLYYFFYQYAAPLVIAICQNLHTLMRTKSLDDVVLPARDGYLIKKAYDILFPEEKERVHYVYLNRNIRNKYYEAAIDDQENEFAKYLKTIPLHGQRTAIFDSVTLNFSAQLLLEKYLSRKILGIYLTCQPDFDMDYVNLSNCSPTYLWRSFGWSICEFFLSSSEPEILDVKDCQPVYADVDAPQQRRQELFTDLEDAVVDTAQRYAEVFGAIDCCPSLNEYFKMLHHLMKSPGKLAPMVGALEMYDEGQWSNILTTLPDVLIEMV